MYDELARAIMLEGKLPNGYTTRTFLPVFFMIKRLVIVYQKMILDIENSENVFNCEHESELFTSLAMQNLLSKMKERFETFEIYFEKIREDVMKTIYTKLDLHIKN
jgi:hypothetical protein